MFQISREGACRAIVGLGRFKGRPYLVKRFTGKGSGKGQIGMVVRYGPKTFLLNDLRRGGPGRIWKDFARELLHLADDSLHLSLVIDRFSKPLILLL